MRSKSKILYIETRVEQMKAEIVEEAKRQEKLKLLERERLKKKEAKEEARARKNFMKLRKKESKKD